MAKKCDYCIEDLYTVNKNKEITIAFYIDAIKVFDTVNHFILIKKLQKFGIKGSLVEWLKNHLTNRKQYTVANNIFFRLSNFTFGVP